ncbi:hypothetical protein [Leuconostoc falkenbergense]|uniref:hypothetical protein n=1 Tax=Leuconostoc falkenbergense TaxID=2766470 RepID=UPI0024A7AC35|nr:hypothetical protein [Leuconostoc falkenbergense]MDI6552412.1 hypothetical protein [Leuconostoc falkenbergense]
METRAHYSLKTRNEVCDKIINRHQSGKSVAAEFEIPYNTVMRWVRQERDTFSESVYTGNKQPYHQVFGYQDNTTDDLAEMKRQIKAMRFELQVLTNQNQELMEMLRIMIENGGDIQRHA